MGFGNRVVRKGLLEEVMFKQIPTARGTSSAKSQSKNILGRRNKKCVVFKAERDGWVQS